MDKEFMEMVNDCDKKTETEQKNKRNISTEQGYAAGIENGNAETSSNTETEILQAEELVIESVEVNDTTDMEQDIVDEDIAEENKSDVTATLSTLLEKANRIDLETAKNSQFLNEIKSTVESINAGYSNTVEALKRSLAANQTNENNIYKELETYKKNQYLMYIRPFLEFMITLLEDFKRSRAEYINDKNAILKENSVDLFNEIINFYDSYIELIQNQLEIQGVEIIKHQTGEKFNAAEQIISKTIATNDSQLVGTVGKAESDCYIIDQKVLKRAKVQVYKLQS